MQCLKTFRFCIFCKLCTNFWHFGPFFAMFSDIRLASVFVWCSPFNEDAIGWLQHVLNASGVSSRIVVPDSLTLSSVDFMCSAIGDLKHCHVV